METVTCQCGGRWSVSTEALIAVLSFTVMTSNHGVDLHMQYIDVTYNDIHSVRSKTVFNRDMFFSMINS